MVKNSSPNAYSSSRCLKIQEACEAVDTMKDAARKIKNVNAHNSTSP